MVNDSNNGLPFTNFKADAPTTKAISRTRQRRCPGTIFVARSMKVQLFGSLRVSHIDRMCLTAVELQIEFQLDLASIVERLISKRLGKK
jgi:hypothetical protein